MTSRGSVRHYRGWAIDDRQEVPADLAATLPLHATAFFGSDGRLTKVELYDGPMLVRVDYHDGRDEETVRRSHLRDHPDVGFTIRRPLGVVRGFTWESVRSYGAGATQEGTTTILVDPNGDGVMEVQADPGRPTPHVTKFYWSVPGTLRYVFESEGDSPPHTVHDVEHGDDRSFAEVEDKLPDPEFYRAGLNLPRALAGTSIPS
jgi:hypothetical protein